MQDCAELSRVMEASAGGAEAVTTAAETGVAKTAGSVGAETGAAGAGVEASEAAPGGRVTTGGTVAGGTGASTRGEPSVETGVDPEVGA